MKILLLLLILGSFNSCYIVKTYDIAVMPAPSQLNEYDRRINELLCLANQCQKDKLKHYVLNGKLLTIKIRKKNEEAIENLVKHIFCPDPRSINCSTALTVKIR